MVDLKTARIKSGLSMRKTARLAGIDYTTLFNAENGMRKPRLSTLNKLSKIYQFNLEKSIDVHGTKQCTLKWYRERLGLTREDVAQNLYVTTDAVQRWENGRNRASIDIQKIADLYGASETDILAAFDRAIEERKNKKREEWNTDG